MFSTRCLTKTRFKLALECPTKLSYTGKAEYLDVSAGNSFLAALAEGGYQVGALACAMFPDGIEVTDVGHAAQVKRTYELLQRDNVTIFEAALQAQDLFVRVDILRKRGGVIEIIEVKAKSFDPAVDGDLRDRNGRLRKDWLPYLQDVAFQSHVGRLAYPQFEFRSFLMLADKTRLATVDGLNQRFRIERDGRRARVQVAGGTNETSLGAPILTRVAVDDAVAEIHAGIVETDSGPMPFGVAASHFASAYRNGMRLRASPGARCGSCQFKASHPAAVGELRSGFHECWSEAFGWEAADFVGGTVLDIWNLRKKHELIAQGVLRPASITLEDLRHDDEDPGLDGMSRSHRQWYQCHAGWPGGGDFYFDADGLRAAMRDWRYPLHFIDFETCAVAIPFERGRRPYETIAFQFSHHVMQTDGRVEHKTQFIEATPGIDPCMPFLRALRTALSRDDGTVFRWATHENTVLNQLRQRLLADPQPASDAAELVAFIESITKRQVDKVEIAGQRCMVDLCKLAERHFFHPATKGSSSLKKVLPALMRSSAFLRDLYGRRVYGGPAMPSLNLSQPTCWWVQRDGEVLDPYDLLPPVFEDVSQGEVDAFAQGLVAELQDGGAAMAAYARLQFEELDERHRKAIEQALLRYCELDTLAMVMAVQAWNAWLVDADASRPADPRPT